MRFPHNDCYALERLLHRARKRGVNAHGQIFVAVEGVYSMDGDLAPLPEISALCEKYNANLVIDDAHGTGVMGAKGAGTAEHFGVSHSVAVSMGTFSKAFGTTGGFIAAKQPVIDYLRFFSRPYMFSAHLPPTTTATVIAGLEVLEQEPELRQKLHANAAYLKAQLNARGLNVRSETPILPVRVPEFVDLRELNRRFHEEGIFLNPIEYPAVPLSEQRLRVTAMATHSRGDLDTLVATFDKLKREFNF
jgi:glycine C-acetyltransferase